MTPFISASGINNDHAILIRLTSWLAFNNWSSTFKNKSNTTMQKGKGLQYNDAFKRPWL